MPNLSHHTKYNDSSSDFSVSSMNQNCPINKLDQNLPSTAYSIKNQWENSHELESVQRNSDKQGPPAQRSFISNNRPPPVPKHRMPQWEMHYAPDSYNQMTDPRFRTFEAAHHSEDNCSSSPRGHQSEDEIVVGSDNDEQEDPSDYREGGYHLINIGDLYNGHYVVLRKLGWGHFSTVWLCWDRSTQMCVAMKVVKSAEHYTEAAMDEIKLLTSVRETDKEDPYRLKCVQLIDNFKINGKNGVHVAMVFEVLGCNLLKLILRSNYAGIPLENVRVITKQILEGLAYLHSKCQIIHTDIKPENVLLCSTEEEIRRMGRTACQWKCEGMKPSSSAVATIPTSDQPLNIKDLSKTQRKRIRRKEKVKTEQLAQILQKLSISENGEKVEEVKLALPPKNPNKKKKRKKRAIKNSTQTTTNNGNIQLPQQGKQQQEQQQQEQNHVTNGIKTNGGGVESNGSNRTKKKNKKKKKKKKDGREDGSATPATPNEQKKMKKEVKLIEKSKPKKKSNKNNNNKQIEDDDDDDDDDNEDDNNNINKECKENVKMIEIVNGTCTEEEKDNLNNNHDRQDSVDKKEKDIVDEAISQILSEERLSVKIADLGNACWVNQHFTEDIQTRQYRALEVLLGVGYSCSADIWSVACTAFELATGDYLFDPHSDKDYGRDEDHIAHIVELLGPIPQFLVQRGRHSPKFFNVDETMFNTPLLSSLQRIVELKSWNLYAVLTEKYNWSSQKAAEFTDFLVPMLEYVPGKRATALDCLKHPWITGTWMGHRPLNIMMLPMVYSGLVPAITTDRIYEMMFDLKRLPALKDGERLTPPPDLKTRQSLIQQLFDVLKLHSDLKGKYSNGELTSTILEKTYQTIESQRKKTISENEKNNNEDESEMRNDEMEKNITNENKNNHIKPSTTTTTITSTTTTTTTTNNSLNENKNQSNGINPSFNKRNKRTLNEMNEDDEIVENGLSNDSSEDDEAAINEDNDKFHDAQEEIQLTKRSRFTDGEMLFAIARHTLQLQYNVFSSLTPDQAATVIALYAPQVHEEAFSYNTNFHQSSVPDQYMRMMMPQLPVHRPINNILRLQQQQQQQQQQLLGERNIGREDSFQIPSYEQLHPELSRRPFPEFNMRNGNNYCNSAALPNYDTQPGIDIDDDDDDEDEEEDDDVEDDDDYQNSGTSPSSSDSSSNLFDNDAIQRIHQRMPDFTEDNYPLNFNFFRNPSLSNANINPHQHLLNNFVPPRVENIPNSAMRDQMMGTPDDDEEIGWPWTPRCRSQ
ncbi:hypothetical protein SNEBB_006000 [Seison nebaliae]|nr:hypothetical protein SNEBB_006000 [Seison nebaliae]